MKIKFNWGWGFLGVLGLLGYVLNEPLYYVFFVFFIFFIGLPVQKKDGDQIKKKEKSQTDELDLYKLSMWLASAALIVSGLVLVIWKTMDNTIAIVIFLSIVILSTNFFQSIGMEKPTKDERLRKIGTVAATYSWYATLSFISFLLVFSYWGGREYNAAEAFGLTILVMVSTMHVANIILNRRGDIE